MSALQFHYPPSAESSLPTLAEHPEYLETEKRVSWSIKEKTETKPAVPQRWV